MTRSEVCKFKLNTLVLAQKIEFQRLYLLNGGKMVCIWRNKGNLIRHNSVRVV